ncbi:MAG TPA: ribosome silencing factor [Gammaproteobacteria bacterium]|jgi:ribosome-associated protein|uniref:Iojap protein n=1 Tax=hydrothermal vent metagenome TaxID=652676 RepID=A0A1W1DNI0_9ZZZZ|nr:ribosome silencing factor [Gammaproteobacteria bacterium]HAE04662.1 ribosome silencing factor [Gammaproteobacteria bacterium]HAE73297.1 ribosome silencing factor [Gammaproteobacteria bacterium]HAO52977.1 ribosome silencing factor [Gammaproteobacteria bacterium]HAO87003.1 ribosome silencing factor [Gammaproteobacteria bacterium]
MNLEQQLKVVTDTIEELKGEDIITLKVLEQSADIEAIVVATGRSIQHVRGIANNLKIEAKRLGMKVVGIEGAETGHWMLVDLAEVVVHVMTEKTREFYKLERLWSGSERSDD